VKTAIYARVSTDDRGQDPENQLRELRAWCEAAGHEVVAEYIDHDTGKNGKRKQLTALFEDAAKRKFGLVVFWALDRFSREGMAATVAHLQRLDSYGVRFHSYTEPHLNTDNELVRDILLALLSSLAKAESVKIGTRVKAGMARVAASGKPWMSRKGRLVSAVGRPKLDPAMRREIAKRLSEGATAYQVAKDMGLSQHTVAKYRPQAEVE
jgi:DNA invertase Pin-like site-specific DNA recombinase